MLAGMQAPRFVHPLTEAERAGLEAGLHAGDAFTLRRCQIRLASARQVHPPAIATLVGCHVQTVRNVIHAFNRAGLASLTKGSSRPQTIHAAFDATTAEQLRDLLHRSPRDVGHPTSMWTLELAADVVHAEGLTATGVSDEPIRATLARLGVGWRRANQWITSPDPAYLRKKGGATG